MATATAGPESVSSLRPKEECRKIQGKKVSHFCYNSACDRRRRRTCAGVLLTAESIMSSLVRSKRPSYPDLCWLSSQCRTPSPRRRRHHRWETLTTSPDTQTTEDRGAFIGVVLWHRHRHRHDRDSGQGHTGVDGDESEYEVMLSLSEEREKRGLESAAMFFSMVLALSFYHH